MTASALGRLSVLRHVTSYTAVQLAGTIVVTRTLGYRIPVLPLLAGTALNSGTHLIIDRREPLLWLARKVGKTGYIEHCTAARVDAEDGTVSAEISGPGTALMELDQALHRAIGVAAALVITWFATRTDAGHRSAQ
ncbi:hypothetical protein [Streptomyces celluloflavus]|uniref:hypothetical protein n=1 Tax=Streptomyces celluloflavus TaxID=58344 RepID=UPI0036A7A8D5